MSKLRRLLPSGLSLTTFGVVLSISTQACRAFRASRSSRIGLPVSLLNPTTIKSLIRRFWKVDEGGRGLPPSIPASLRQRARKYLDHCWIIITRPCFHLTINSFTSLKIRSATSSTLYSLEPQSDLQWDSNTMLHRLFTLTLPRLPCCSSLLLMSACKSYLDLLRKWLASCVRTGCVRQLFKGNRTGLALVSAVLFCYPSLLIVMSS